MAQCYAGLIYKQLYNLRVRTCQEESNSRTFQGHLSPCVSKFKDYLTCLDTEKKALEISTM